MGDHEEADDISMEFMNLFNKLKSQINQAKESLAGEKSGEAPPPAVSGTGTGSGTGSGSGMPAARRADGPSSSGTGRGEAAGRPAELSDGSVSPMISTRESTPGVPGLRTRGDGPAIAGIVQNDKDDSVYNMRNELVQRVEAMFGEFGPQVCAYMLTQALTTGGIARVVKKLGLTSRGRDGADMAQVEAWILKNGVEPFCKVAGVRIGPAAPPPPMPDPGTGMREGKDPRVRPLDPSALPVREGTAQGRPGGGGTSPGYSPPPGFSKGAVVGGAHPAPPPPQRYGAPTTPPANPHAPATPPGGAPQGHLRKVSVTPIGLAGKDIQKVNLRSAAETEPDIPPARYGSIPTPPPTPPPPRPTIDLPRPLMEENPTPTSANLQEILDQIIEESSRHNLPKK